MYKSIPSPFNHFLISALGVLFLAVCHAPTLFSKSVRRDYHTATRLLKACSSPSRGSPRIRKLISELRSIGTKLGLSSQPVTDQAGPIISIPASPIAENSELQETGTDTAQPPSVPPNIYDYTTEPPQHENQESWEIGDLFLAAGNPFFNSAYDSSGFDDTTAGDDFAFQDSVDLFGFDNDQELTDIIADLLR